MNLEHFIARRLAFTKSRSFTKIIIRIATASVSVSLAVMIITSATITGFKNEITDKIFGFWGHIHITDTSINRTFEPSPIEAEMPYLDSLRNIRSVEITSLLPSNRINDKLQRKFQSKGGVKQVQSFAIAPGIINTDDDFEGILLKGIGADYNWEQMSEYIVEGDIIDTKGEEASSDILISQETADRLKLETGEQLIIGFVKEQDQLRRRFRIGGIYKTGLVEYDQRFAMADIRKVQNVLGWSENQVGGFEVFLDDIDDLNILNEYIYLEVIPNNLYSETIRMKFPSIFEWLQLQDINEEVILLLMIIVSVLNMITALLILILERTNMIGILKSLGSRNWSIRRIFLYHSAYIIGWGLFFGNLFGIGLCLLQDHFGFLKLDEQSYYLSVAPIELQLWNIIGLNMAAMAIILIFLIIPSYLVTKISPLKAIRYR